MMNRMMQWAAAAMLAASSVPAISLARTRASIPSDVVSVTPASGEGRTTARPAAHRVAHKKVSQHRKVTSRKHTARRSRKAHARTHARTKRHSHRAAS